MAELSVAVHGPRDGPAVLLVHGFPFDRAMWRLQVGPLTAAGYRLVLPDLPGFGRSEVPPAGSVDVMARDLLATLDRLRVQRFVACGFSMGGYVALALAALAPDRLAGLVLIDSKAGADSDEGKAKRDATVEKVNAHGSRAIVPGLLEGQLTAATRSAERLLTEEVRAMMMRQPKAAVIAAVRAMRDRPDRTDALRKLACPVLVLHGGEDKVIPADAARAAAEAAKDGEFVAIPGAAHLSPMERPDAVNAALVDWLKKAA